MPTRRAVMTVIGYGLLGVVGIVGALSIMNYKNWEPVELPMGPIIGVTAVLVLGGAIAIGKAAGDFALGMYVVAAIGPVTCAWISYGFVPAINAVFDDSPATTHHVKVRRFERHRGKSYWIYVDSWRPGHTEEKLFTTKAVKERNPAYVDIVSHEGALGLEFVTSKTESK